MTDYLLLYLNTAKKIIIYKSMQHIYDRCFSPGSVSSLLSPYATFPGDPGERRIIKLLWIIIAHASVCHQLQGDCVSSWLVPTLAGFSLCHLAPVSFPPSCYVTSTHSKQLRGTNSEKPELWVTNEWKTSELTATDAQSRPFSRVIKHSSGHLCDSVRKLVLFA